MTDYLIRYRNLSGDDPMSPISEHVEAPSAQAAIAELKARHPDQDLRIERTSDTAPPPKKRRTRAEWIILAFVVVLGGVNLVTRMLR